MYAAADVARRSRSVRKGFIRKKSAYAEVMHKKVRFPSSHFSNDIPGMYYIGRVSKKDNSHNGCVIVTFTDPDVHQRCYLPVEVSDLPKAWSSKEAMCARAAKRALRPENESVPGDKHEHCRADGPCRSASLASILSDHHTHA